MSFSFLTLSLSLGYSLVTLSYQPALTNKSQKMTRFALFSQSQAKFDSTELKKLKKPAKQVEKYQGRIYLHLLAVLSEEMYKQAETNETLIDIVPRREIKICSEL
jgi:hypothetical protein